MNYRPDRRHDADSTGTRRALDTAHRFYISPKNGTQVMDSLAAFTFAPELTAERARNVCDGMNVCAATGTLARLLLGVKASPAECARLETVLA